jgi:hypothetical protein
MKTIPSGMFIQSAIAMQAQELPEVTEQKLAEFHGATAGVEVDDRDKMEFGYLLGLMTAWVMVQRGIKDL